MEQRATVSVSDNVIHCRGPWTLPNLAELERRGGMLRWPDAQTVIYDAGEVTAMDTGGAMMLQQSINGLRHMGRKASLRGLKPEFAELLQMVETQWSHLDREGAVPRVGWVERLTRAAQQRRESAVRVLAFLGESTIAFWRSIWSRSARDAENPERSSGVPNLILASCAIAQNSKKSLIKTAIGPAVLAAKNRALN